MRYVVYAMSSMSWSPYKKSNLKIKGQKVGQMAEPSDRRLLASHRLWRQIGFLFDCVTVNSQ